MSDLRTIITEKLTAFSSSDLRSASLSLLNSLGYQSDKTMPIEGADPQAFLELIQQSNPDVPFNQEKAIFSDWTSADILFQLTDDELSHETSLFEDHQVKPSLLRSYLFFAIELNGKSAINGSYARGKLTAIARQLNRIFPMPVMLLIKHPKEKQPVLSIAVINRRQNKRDTHKDVLGKVTIIRDILLDNPHRGHQDILASFAFSNLTHPQKLSINSFDTLHASWEEIFNVELLNKRFYKELANWYFWAMQKCHFPFDDIEKNKDDLLSDTAKVREHDAKNLIRLLTRTLFVWFIKERQLVPNSLFDPVDLKNDILKKFDPESKETNYYKTILQNLFFATLNQTHGKREFRNDGQHQNTTTLLRYKDQLQAPEEFITTLESSTPFLNGGLFDCLDYPHPTKTGKQGGRVIVYEDGFSDRKDNPLCLPDFLFFGSEQTADLSGDLAYGATSYKKEKVRGLIHILNSYKFTIVENTPIDQEIALDPELLGQVFENLLASYNPETKTTARKQTGSFYTPRPIVDYMVDESLKAHLSHALQSEAKMIKADADAGLDILFAYTELDHAFSSGEVAILIRAIDSCKILDPACGSGAFPMGILQKLVYILSKLDPDNIRWKSTQLDKLDSSTMRDSLESDFADNDDDYGRKLYLIENCLYGVDIQSIATQVSKLRFFISLIVDQRVDKEKDNFGVRPLPNLETKFVTANTLIQLDKPNLQTELAETADIAELKRHLKRIRHKLFSAKTPTTKNKYREEDKQLREQIATELKTNGWLTDSAQALADWDPYDQNASEKYFDPEWMFGEKGFDIVIGNPPYGASISADEKKYFKSTYKHQDYQLDTYLLFIERGVLLLKKDGIQSLIIPNTWLPSVMLKSIRKFIFGKTSMVSLVDIKTSVFTAIVDNNILTHKLAPRSIRQHHFPVHKYDDIGLSHLHTVEQSSWYSDEGHPVSVALTPKRRVLAELIQKQKTLSNFFSITPGCKAYQRGKGKPKQTTETVQQKPFTSDIQVDSSFRPLLRGKLIKPFEIIWQNNLWIKFGEWLAEPRLTAQYEAPLKILLRQTGDSLIAALDQEQFIIMNNMFTIVPSDSNAPTFFTLAALNSSTLNWYYQNYINPEKGEAMAEIKKGHLVRLPLPTVSNSFEDTYKDLTNLIQLAKKDNAHTPEAAFLDDLLDACVMECYFHDHMAELDLLFLDELAPSLASYDAELNDENQLNFLESFVSNHNAPTAKIRNRLLRITTDSPELLAVIKQEGKV